MTQLDYERMKYLRRIVVMDVVADPGDLGPLRNGWASARPGRGAEIRR